MIYRIYANKDTTIYEDSNRKAQNTGKDQILEVSKLYDPSNTNLLGNSRALISFDLTDISKSVSDGTITSPEYRLRLENVESTEIQENFDLFVYPIKESWVEGLGQEGDTPHHEEGCTWESPSSGTWNVTGALVGDARDSSLINSLVSSIDFVSGLGGFELVDKIAIASWPSISIFTKSLFKRTSFTALPAPPMTLLSSTVTINECFFANLMVLN